MDAYVRTCTVAMSVRDLIWNVCRSGSLSEIASQLENAVSEEYQSDNEIGDGYTPIVGDH